MEDSLVMRRPKRSTAGNRMEAALAEFKAEEVGVDIEEDNDFVIDKDEEDAFESDFESTDEEAAQDDVDAAAERMVREDEGRRRKPGGKTQLERITAAAHEIHKATFNPQIHEAESSQKASSASKFKRRVSLGVVVDAETGEVMATEGSEGPGKRAQRQSRRKSTVENRTAHIERLRKEEQEKKTAAPKKVKTKARPPTQEELLKRALEMEEGNIEEHKNYLQTEEEKRKRARLVRTAVEGPLLRLVTKAEQVKVIVEPPPPPPPPPASTSVRPIITVSSAPSASYQYGYSYPGQPAPNVAGTQPATLYPSSSMPYYPYATMQPAQAPPPQPGPTPPAPGPQPTFIYHTYSTPETQLTTTQTSDSLPAPSTPPAPPPLPEERLETVGKSYVIYEMDQGEDAPRPLWKDTMGAMFGDHTKWEDLRVFTGRNRPMTRPVQNCPLTGQPARYLDPRTGVPFANVQAFKTLTGILQHDFVWSASLGCYTSRADEMIVDDADSETQEKATTKADVVEPSTSSNVKTQAVTSVPAAAPTRTGRRGRDQ